VVCLEVDAPHVLVPNRNFLPADLSSSFSCGSFQCSYQMGQFQSGVYRGVWLNVNLLGKTGNGRWVQTFSNGNTGEFQADWDSTNGTPYPIYPSYASSNSYFDDPAGLLGSSKTWVAQTSYVLSSGAAFTFMWGYQLSPNGIATYNAPVVVGPWASQQQLIQAAQ
jgi:hypothetical protein